MSGPGREEPRAYEPDDESQLRQPLQQPDESASPRAQVPAREWPVVLVVLAVSYGCYLHGTTVTFPAVFVPMLMAEKALNGTNASTVFNANLAGRVAEEDIPLIVSISSFGMLLGSLSAGPLAGVFGRKWTSLIGTGGCLCASYAILPWAGQVSVVLVSRFLMGAGLGFSTTLSTLYIMEVATPQMRARLAVVPAIAGTLGVLSCQLLGALLPSWQWLCVGLGLLHVPFFVAMLAAPETPVHLLRKDRIEAAHTVLRRLRGRGYDVTTELTDLKVASEASHLSASKTSRLTFAELVMPETLKPLLVALALMFFFQFSGITVIMQYTVEIFQSAQSSINEFLANILVGLALLVSNGLTLFLAAKMPRRSMLLCSSLGVSLCLTVLGIYYYLQTLEEEAVAACEEEACPEAVYTQHLRWLPLAILMCYIFVFNLGYGAMIWLTVAELLPLRVRPVANSVSVAFTCLCSFVSAHSFQPLFHVIKGEGVFWAYASISFVGFLFILLLVPETKDKSEAEIASFFKRRRERSRAASSSEQQEMQPPVCT